MNYWILIICIGLNFFSNAQEVIVNETVYHIKGDKITLDDVDVTTKLSFEEKEQIRTVLKQNIAEEKKTKKLEKTQKKQQKEQKKLEKEAKQAQKKQKQAEKALKKKQKARNNFNAAKKKHLQAQNKYEKLKKRGKLSPDDEVKWFKKIEQLNNKIIKAERKL
jgi:Mg-chelatase subunit ChlI